jgi:hypothetical protein
MMRKRLVGGVVVLRCHGQLGQGRARRRLVVQGRAQAAAGQRTDQKGDGRRDQDLAAVMPASGPHGHSRSPDLGQSCRRQSRHRPSAPQPAGEDRQLLGSGALVLAW